jgi:hypothetical protein
MAGSYFNDNNQMHPIGIQVATICPSKIIEMRLRLISYLLA